MGFEEFLDTAIPIVVVLAGIGWFCWLIRKPLGLLFNGLKRAFGWAKAKREGGEFAMPQKTIDFE